MKNPSIEALSLLKGSQQHVMIPTRLDSPYQDGLPGELSSKTGWLRAASIKSFRSLSRNCSRHGISSNGKSGIDGIADHFENKAIMGGDDGTQQDIVSSESRPHGLGIVLPTRSAAFNIGEEERDGASWPFRHG